MHGKEGWRTANEKSKTHSPMALFLHLRRCKSTALAERERKTIKPQQNAKRSDIISVYKKKKSKREKKQHQTEMSEELKCPSGSPHRCRSYAYKQNDLLIRVLENYTCGYKSTCQHSCTHTHINTAAWAGSTGATSEDARLSPPPPSPVLPLSLSLSASSAVSGYSPQIISQENAMVGSLHFLRPCHPPVSRPPCSSPAELSLL